MTRKQYDRILSKARAADARRLEAQVLMQHSCDHPNVVEANESPPFAVCTLCGYAEQGWHCGYWKLAHRRLRRVTALTARETVIGRIWTQRELSEERYGVDASSL